MMITTCLTWLLGLMANTAPAESPEISMPPGMGPPGAPMGGPASEGKPDFPKFDEVTKDMKVHVGFMTLYFDEKKDKLLARIPKDRLNKNFLLATSIAKGPFYAGFQWVDGAVYWERLDKKLVLMAPDPSHARGKGSTVEDVITRTYTDSIIRAVPIVTETEGDPVIDLAELLKFDLVSLKMVFDGRRVDQNLSRYGQFKNFERNTEIAVDLALMAKEPRAVGQVVSVHYSFSHLPENDYRPRPADLRVGYFLTPVKDWSTAHDAATIFRRYIHRWQLRKAEPDQEVSDVLPEDQIIFYIEKTVPVKFRPYVRDGILEWNRAFEAVGLRNAVVVRQQTDKNEYKDLDPEDVRYNFFRWIVSGVSFAMGPSRVNPFTGQILDADIVFDDSMIRVLLEEFDVSGPRAVAGYPDDGLDEFFANHDRWNWGLDTNRLWEGLASNPDRAQFVEQAQTRPAWRPDRAQCACQLGLGAARQLAMASFEAAAAGERKLSDEYIGQVIKEITMHEVGHTLGLRHNFKASSWLPMSEIKARRMQDGKATTASVMDYNPSVYAKSIAEQGVFTTPTIGPYDYWAIEYGYRPYSPGKPKPTESSPSAPAGTDAVATDGTSTKGTDGESAKKSGKEKESGGEGAGKGPRRGPRRAGPKEDPNAEAELAMLRSIASRCAEPGLAYATDEDTSFLMPDPTVNRFDNGSDVLEFAKDRMTAVEALWKSGLDWAVKDGDSLNRARRVMDVLLGEYGYVAPMVARYVGGIYVNRDQKGDADARPPMQSVPSEKQRQALKLLSESALSDAAFQFPPALLNGLAPGRWGHWDSDAFDRDAPYDVHARVLWIQARVLFQLLNPFTMNRLYDVQAQVSPNDNPLTLPELLRVVSAAVWSELDQAGAGDKTFTVRQPLISSFRRSLQRHHAQVLIDTTLRRPGSEVYADAHAVIWVSLRDLGARIDKVLAERSSRLDDFTKAHLTDSAQRIKKALEAEFVANPKPTGDVTVIRIGAGTNESAAP